MSVVSRVVRSRPQRKAADSEFGCEHGTLVAEGREDDVVKSPAQSSRTTVARWTPVGAAVVALLVALAFLWQAWQLKSPASAEVSSRLFPLFVAALMVSVSSWLLLSALIDVVRGAPQRTADIGESITGMDRTCAVSFVAATLVFVFSFEYLGAFVSVGLYIFAVSTLIAPKRWRRNALAALGVAALFYLVFVVGFSVRLPEFGGA